MKQWTLEDQLALVRGSRTAKLRYRLRSLAAKRQAERSTNSHALTFRKGARG